MKTYLVTGGAGFIGSNYIHYMFKKYKDIKIVNLDKLTYAGNPENLKEFENNENYVFIKEDICNAEAVNKIFQEYDIDRVVHFAAESHEMYNSVNIVQESGDFCADECNWNDSSFECRKKCMGTGRRNL